MQSTIEKRGMDFSEHFNLGQKLVKLENEKVHFTVTYLKGKGKKHMLTMKSNLTGLERTLVIGSVELITTFVIGMLYQRDTDFNY